ncbi:hypothetical protein [Pseudomonas proteolytica]|uniref:hypothetical protein n=1 Tax=Pseudomonas proteolytica TaxID=219574 RepID=UPI0030EE071E
MSKHINKILLRESSKKEKALAEIKRSSRNWPLHRERCLVFFRAVAKEARSKGFSFQVVDAKEIENLNMKFTSGQGSRCDVEDNVALTFAVRTMDGVTRNYIDGVLSDISREKEYGASLVVHHRYSIGLTHVFLVPPHLEGSEQSRNEIIVYYTFNLDDIHVGRLRSLLSMLFVMQRVGGVDERSSLLDRVRFRYWKFMDARNREVVEGGVHKFLTTWEIYVFVGAVGALSLIGTYWPIVF